MHWKFKLLLGFNIIYCVLGAASNTLPAWKMFESVEKFDYELVDRHGKQLDVRDFLPTDAYIVRFRNIYPIVSFICQKKTEDAPFHFKSKSHDVEFTLNSDRCEIPHEILNVDQ